MGDTDVLTKEYMKDAEVFADVLNYFLYDGEKVIDPEELHELDTTELASLYEESDSSKEKKTIQVYRDVLKYAAVKGDDERAYVIFAIENQTNINYAMPVKTMLYDSLRYNSQVKNIEKKNKRKNKELKMSGDELISGLMREDKILPVVTLVVYFGAKPWDGPKSLHEMLDCNDETLLKYVNDYKLQLIEPAAMSDEEIDRLKSDLRDVFFFIKYSKDKEKLREIINSNEKYRHMSRDTAELINKVTKAGIEISKREETVDMCIAIEEMKEESKAEGIAIGIKEGELNLLFKLVQKGFLTIEKAASELDMTVEQFKEAMAYAEH